MGILFATDNLWSCKPLNDQMITYAARLQEFLEWAQHSELGVYDAVADWVIELCQLGTGVLKQRYKREQKKVYQFRETDFGTLEQQLMLLIHDHPVVEHTSLWNLLVPSSAIDIQNSPWVQENITANWGQLQARMRGGIYQGGENLSVWRGRGQNYNAVEQALQRQDLFVPSLADKFDLKETWLEYDISAAGEPCALVCTMHLPSMTLLRLDYNPFFNQEIPFSKACYLRQAKRFYGLGLAEMLYDYQLEVSTMHNQRLDSATLANSTMFKAKTGIGIRQDEPVFPGRWFILDNPETDIIPMNVGQRFDSTVPYEQMTLTYASRRTGVNDYISGDFSPAMGYSTATVGVQQLKESAKRFDQTMREVRIALGETGTRVVELYQQFNQHGKEYLAMGQKDGAQVHQLLQFPLEWIRASVGVELTATSAALNKDVEIRTNTLVMQMLMQFYSQIMTALSYVYNPQIPPPIRQAAAQMVDGGSILMRRILDTYGIQDADRLVPELWEAIGDGQQRINAFQQAVGPGQNGAGGYPPQAGMAGAPQGFAGAQGPSQPLALASGY
jgi:hypothetical protein